MVKFLPLEQVCTQIIDCPHESPEWRKEGVPIIRNFNLIDGQLNMSDGYFVDEGTYQRRIRRATPQYGDIIFSREAPIGNCCIVPQNYRCCLGQRLVLLKVNNKVCSSEYLLTALLSNFVKKQIEQIAKTGSIVSNFAICDLKKLIIPIIDEQQNVTEVATTINSTISLNNSICSDLEAMAKQLYDYWFVQFDFPDENGKPYKTSGGKMVWNEELNREIPEGWKVEKFGSLVTMGNGINYDKNEIGDKAYKIVNVRNISASSFWMDIKDFDDIVLKSKQADRYLVDKNDILIARSGTPGAVRLIHNVSDNIIYCGFIIHALPKDIEQRLYLAYCLKQLEGTNATKTGGSILQNVSQDTLAAVNIIVPDGVTLRTFNGKVNVIAEKINSILSENQQLNSLRDFLLPMLMNGQVGINKQ